MRDDDWATQGLDTAIVDGMSVESATPSAKLPRLLFVSRHYASNFGAAVGGIFQRMHMLLDAAVKATNALDILFFVDQYMIDQVGPSAAQASLRDDWGIEATVYLAPRSTKQRDAFNQMARGWFDFREQEDYFRSSGRQQTEAIRARVEKDTALVVAHRLAIGAAATARDALAIPIVMDLDDIEHRNLARQLLRPPLPIDKRLRWLEVRALKRGELATIQATRTSLVCSKSDQDYLVAQGAPKTTVIPNAIRFPERAPPNDDCAQTLFFIGAYGYSPNVDAAEYLVHEIFPRVLAKLPEARLMLAGESIEKLPSYSRCPPQVDFIGFVSDLAEVYRKASVVCCPVLAGGGTRIKIIEAAAAGKAVVSTTIGAEGLDFDRETEILLRDSSSAFADACIDLLTDKTRSRSIGKAAFEKARRLYDRNLVVDRLVEVFVASAKA